MEQYIKLIKPLMSEKRFRHSMGVMETSMELAKKFGADVEKACIAGIFHDCVKDFSYEEMEALSKKYNLVLDDDTKSEKKLIHANLGAEYMKNEFGICDEDIYNAVFYHTTGRADMSLLEKIIYISDYIEPNRNYPGVEALRESINEGLDVAVINGINNTLGRLIEKNRMIHPDTIRARNFLIKEKIKNER